MFIDWQDSESHIFLNPKLPQDRIDKYKELYRNNPSEISGHIWLTTSGTTSSQSYRLVGLSKEAILESAKSVNDHIDATKKDVWLNPLPRFHIGGLSIYARSFLKKNHVVDFVEKWSVNSFLQSLQKNRVTIISLVPTQIFDLVDLQSIAPSHVRVVFVGGGRLNEELYIRARKLGWPILMTYGMTELCSQVATNELSTLKEVERYPDLKILSHVSIRTNSEGRILIKSTSSLSGYLEEINGKVRFTDPKKKGEFYSDDFGELLEDKKIKVCSRLSSRVKVLGELVNIEKLERELNTYLSSTNKFVIISVPHKRKESSLGVVVENMDLGRIQKKIQKFNQKVSPVERLSFIYIIHQLPKTALGKIDKNTLKKHLGF